MPPNVNVRSLEAPATTPGTPTTITAEINNRELVTPLLGPATCGGNTGHKTEVTVEVRDPAGAVVFEEAKTICAEGDSLGNEQTVPFEFTPSTDGEHTVRASTRVIGHEIDSDSAGPASLTIESDAGDLPDSSGGGGGPGLDYDPGDFSGDGDGGGLLDVGPDLPSSDLIIGLVVLALAAWALSSAEGIIG